MMDVVIVIVVGGWWLVIELVDATHCESNNKVAQYVELYHKFKS